MYSIERRNRLANLTNAGGAGGVVLWFKRGSTASCFPATVWPITERNKTQSVNTAILRRISAGLILLILRHKFQPDKSPYRTCGFVLTYTHALCLPSAPAKRRLKGIREISHSASLRNKPWHASSYHRIQPLPNLDPVNLVERVRREPRNVKILLRARRRRRRGQHRRPTLHRPRE